MVSGRGGGQVGRDGSGLDSGGSSNDRADEKTEKVRSDAARIRGTYRFSRYGVAPPPVFSKRESTAY
jgi:hypothetical protein